MSATILRDLDYDSIVLDEELGPLTFAVEEEIVQDYSYAFGDLNPWYFGPSPFGGERIVPSWLLLALLERLIYGKYDAETEKGIHARQYIKHYSPIRLDQKVTLTGQFTDKFFRRGRPYYRMGGDVLSESGEVLMSQWFEEIIDMTYDPEAADSSHAKERRKASLEKAKKGSRVEPRTSSLPIAPHASRDLAPETPIPSIYKKVSRKKMRVFSTTDFTERNIHTDKATAQRKGLKDSIANGVMMTGALNQLCTRFFGKKWFTSGELTHALLFPTYADTNVVVGGIVTHTEKDSTGMRVYVDVWAEAEDGVLLTAGRASAYVT